MRSRLTGAALPLLAIAWVLVFSVVGGANSLLGLVGFVWLRGTNRFSIWILAIALLTAGTSLSRLRFVRRRSWSVVAATLVLLLSLLDQVPPSASDPDLVRESVASDRAFVANVEALLPEGGSLFVEPALDFPEAPRHGKALDYEALRLYLHASRLRFSYGTDKNRPGAAFAPAMDALELPDRIKSLGAEGFSGIILTCRALPDDGQELVDELHRAGYPEMVRSEDEHFIFVPLRAGARRTLPPAFEPRN